MPGIKHLIECHCSLIIFKNNDKQIYHKFPVYSIIDKNQKVISKIVKCNNCEALHKVYDIERSEIFPGKDQTEYTIEIDDLAISMPEQLVKILKKYNSDISNYEHAKNIIEEKRWGEIIILKREILEEKEQIKYIEILSNQNFSIKTNFIENTIILE
jgi:hypothetical protein